MCVGAGALQSAGAPTRTPQVPQAPQEPVTAAPDALGDVTKRRKPVNRSTLLTEPPVDQVNNKTSLL